jgi:hypothetical protein
MSANSRPCTWLDSGHDGTRENVFLKLLFGGFLFHCTGREPPFDNGVVARYVDVDAEDRLYEPFEVFGTAIS